MADLCEESKGFRVLYWDNPSYLENQWAGFIRWQHPGACEAILRRTNVALDSAARRYRDQAVAEHLRARGGFLLRPSPVL